MKTNDEKDPLTDKDFDQQEPAKKRSKPLKEEEEKKKDQPTQEDKSTSPDEISVSDTQPPVPAPESPSKTLTEDPIPEDPPEPASEAQAPEDPPEPASKAQTPEDPPEPGGDDIASEDTSTAPHSQAVEAPSESHSEKQDQKTSKARKGSGSLLDDSEEKGINDAYDDEVDDDEEKNQEESPKKKGSTRTSAPSGEERVNYSLLSKNDLVKLLREKLDNPAKGNIRKDVEEIRQGFYEKVREAREDKKEHFLNEGGNLEDFKPVEDPLEAEMKDLMKKYRGLKAEFTKQLEKSKQENLEKKQEILEQFRIVMEGQESFEITFRKFKDLQRQWFAVGVVPQQNLKDLWDSYNYFVDKFNDYVRINRELRALDLKKNLELKMQLCNQTEALEQESNVVQAFKKLQKFHTRWREIGPVPRENRDEIWERFKKATSIINRKHQEYHSRLKESLYDNLKRKEELCIEVETIASGDYQTHGDWIENTNKVLEIQKTWKTIGYAPKKDNNAIYARFRRACDAFFGSKAKFYAEAYEEQKENLKLKQEITERAEALRLSDEWKETTHELIRLQKQWKEIGPVPRRDSDKLWKRFRAACDTFFNNKSKYFEDIDSTFDENLKEKEKVIEEMDAFKPADIRKENLSALEDFQSRFNSIGFVPASKKDSIKEQFRQAQDSLLERIGLDETERSLFRFKQRVNSISSAPRSDMKMNFERDKLVNKLQQLKNDIGVWENNIGFIKQSDSSEDTIQGYHEKIESARERIHLLEQKIRILDDMDNEN